MKPGDKIPIAGIDVEVVTARGVGIKNALAGGGAANPVCGNFVAQEKEQAEDSRSVGLIVRHGRFRSMQLGDLTWNKDMSSSARTICSVPSTCTRPALTAWIFPARGRSCMHCGRVWSS